jgi:hypothetical protein
MGSNYLQGVTDGYGLPATLAPGLAELASTIVDSYLKRPEGLIYTVDNNGNPCAMSAATPSFTYTLQGTIAPGTNVVVSVTPPLVKPDMVGEVLVIDFGIPNIVEACVVVSTTGNNQITLGTVQFAHAAQAKADVGRVITEDRNCPSKRSIVRVAKWPIVSVLSLLGRYAYGRRSDQVGGLYQEMNLLASVQTFGGPPMWVPIAIAQASWSDATGEIWVPAGMLLAYYSDVRVKYVTGFPSPPDPVVRATAKIASDLNNTAGIAGQIKMISAGDTRIQKFSASTIDDNVKGLLEPYRARTMF